jgi:hypothetical protein
MTMLTSVHVENSEQGLGSNRPVHVHLPPKTADIHCSAVDFALFRNPYLGRDWVCQLPRAYGHGSHGPRAWCIDLDHLVDGLRAKPRALLHCRYQRHLFPDQRWWDFWQQLLAAGDRDGAARLMAEALYAAVRVASFELVLTFLLQAQQRKSLSARCQLHRRVASIT